MTFLRGAYNKSLEVGMKIRGLALYGVVVLSMCTTLSADTIPGGDVSGTWFAANSPYYMMCVSIIAVIMVILNVERR